MNAKRHSRFWLVVVLVALGALATSCASDAVVDTGSPTTVADPGDDSGDPIDANDPAERLAAARQTWAENGPTSYVLITQLQCFCPVTEWKNVVVDGEVTSTVATGEDTFIEPQAQTMETLFDEVESAIRDGYAHLDLEFAPDTGALLSYWVDVDERMADEEHGVVITLSPIDEETAETTTPPAAAVDAGVAGTLEDDYGCGFGFAKGNKAQTVGLIIYHTGGYSETGPDISSPIEFPNDAWVGELRTGSDLFANWCDDVMEEGEPVPEVAEVWTIAAGTLTVAEVDSPNVVEGVFTGVVVESPDGEHLELGDIEVSNTGYGFFAG